MPGGQKRPAPGTRLDSSGAPAPRDWSQWEANYGEAIRVAQMELLGPRRNPDADPMIVVFGDGVALNTLADPSAAVAAARAAGIRIIVVGIFPNGATTPQYEQGASFLKKIASDPQSANYFELTSDVPAEVKAVFPTIVDTLCDSERVIVEFTNGPVGDYVWIPKGGIPHIIDVLRNDNGSGGDNLVIEKLNDLDTALGADEGIVELLDSSGNVVAENGEKVRFTPVPNAGGVFRHLSYRVTVGGTTYEDVPLWIFVDRVNSPPVAIDDAYVIFPGNVPVNLPPVRQNDYDPDFGEVDQDFQNPRTAYRLPISSFTQPKAGTGSIRQTEDGELQYVPPTGADWQGLVEFTYTIRDTFGQLAMANVTIEVTDPVHNPEWRAIEDVWIYDAQDSAVFEPLLNDVPRAPRVIELIAPPDGVTTTDGLIVEYHPPGGLPSSPVTFWYRVARGNDAKYSARVTMGFTKGTQGTLQAAINNLDRQEGTELPFVTRKGLLEVIGTASDSNPDTVVCYNLTVFEREHDGVMASVFHVGPVTDGSLGVLDLRSVPNGSYKVQLIVAHDGDANGNNDDLVIWKDIFIDSDAKVGQLAFTETDLNIPIEGLPIVINRSYDSFDKRIGDFGVGWQLSVSAGKLEHSMIGDGWRGVPAGHGYCIRNKGVHLLKVTLPGGEAYEFVPQLRLSQGGECHLTPGDVQATIVYLPVTDAQSSLAELGQDELFVRPKEENNWAGEIRVHSYEAEDEIYNPSDFVFTAPDGRQVIFKNGAATNVRDRNGYGLRFTPEGDLAEHGSWNAHGTFVPSGTAVRFARLNDRITELYSPLDNNLKPTIVYEYDASQRHLIRVKRLVKQDAQDPTYATTHYFYGASGYPGHEDLITEIKDDLGIVVRNEYDEKGRLVATTDGEGRRTEYEHGEADDDGNSRETIIDPLGNRTVHEYDARGNITRTRDALGNEVARVYYYDARDRITQDSTSWINSSGNTEEGPVIQTFQYHDNSDVVSEKTTRLPDGSRTIHEYNGFGDITKFTDANNHVTEFNYVVGGETPPSDYFRAIGRLKEIIHPADGLTAFIYGEGRITETDAANNRIEQVYDSRGLLTQMNEYKADDVTPIRSVVFTTDANGNIVRKSVTRKRPGSENVNEVAEDSYLLDARGRRLSTVTSLQTFEGQNPVPPYAAPFVIANPEPTLTYDARGNVTREVRVRTVHPELGAAATVETQVTRLEYDQSGRLRRRIYPDNLFEEYIYDGAARLVATTDRAGRTSQRRFDAAGRLTAVIDTDGRETVTEYNSANRPTSIRNARGLVTRHHYDVNGRRLRTIDPLQGETSYSYDPVGNLRTITEPSLGGTTPGVRTEYFYDAANRVERIHYPNETESLVHYTAGVKDWEKDAENRYTLFKYHGKSLLKEVTVGATSASATPEGPDAVTTTYAYDEVGNLLTQKQQGKDNPTRFEHDAFGRIQKKTLPGGEFETRSYDEVGNLVSRTDFDDKITRYSYDNLNRLIEITPDATFGVEKQIQFAYTANGRRARMDYPVLDNERQVVTYHYAASGQLQQKRTRQVTAQGAEKQRGDLHYAYDEDGHVTNVVVMHGASRTTHIGYEWDSNGQLSRVLDQSAGVTQITTYELREDGALGAYVLPNQVRVRFDYVNGHWLSLVEARASRGNGAALASFTYTPDRSAQRRQVDEAIGGWSGRTVTWEYDGLKRLTRQTFSGMTPTGSIVYDDTPGYTEATGGFDKSSNRRYQKVTPNPIVSGIASRNYTFDENDRILAQEQYDGNGNTTAAVGINGVLTYDFANRLISRSGSGTAVEFAYDGDGNRVMERKGGVTTHFVVDELNPTGYSQVVEEVQGEAETPARIYVPGHDLLYQHVKDGTGWKSSYYGYDAHGSVRYLTDSTGTITDRYAYDGFGQMLKQEGTTANRYLFAGEQYDSELGLYYLRARHYNPVTGRFLSLDNFEGYPSDPLSLHKYLYAHADPVNRIDPSGHESLASVNLSISLISQLTTHELRGASAILNYAQEKFANDDSFGSLIYGLDISLAVVDTTSYVTAGAGAIYAGYRTIKFVTSALARKGPNIVYRALRIGELESIAAGNGITRGAGNTTPTQHVLGAQHPNNPFVSTTRSLESAEYFATHGGTKPSGPIVAIDLDKVNARVIDVSTPQNAAANLRHPRAVRFSAKHQEVLIQGNVDTEAIVEIIQP